MIQNISARSTRHYLTLPCLNTTAPSSALACLDVFPFNDPVTPLISTPTLDYDQHPLSLHTPSPRHQLFSSRDLHLARCTARQSLLSCKCHGHNFHIACRPHPTVRLPPSSSQWALRPLSPSCPHSLCQICLHAALSPRCVATADHSLTRRLHALDLAAFQLATIALPARRSFSQSLRSSIIWSSLALLVHQNPVRCDTCLCYYTASFTGYVGISARTDSRYILYIPTRTSFIHKLPLINDGKRGRDDD